MVLTLSLSDADALPALRDALVAGEADHGEVVVALPTGADAATRLRLGTGFALDGDLAERLQAIEGLHDISLKPRKAKARLRLVA